MGRTFAYVRVSTADQKIENQIQEIATKGFEIASHRIITETISGSTPASERPGFQKLLMRLETGDRLVVSKFDRLGRNAVDVKRTVTALTQAGVEVHCLALPNIDLSTAVGGMLLNIISAFAEFELDLLKERTNAGLERAKAQGKAFGRPRSLTDEQKAQIEVQLRAGATISALAKKLKVSRATVMRALHRNDVQTQVGEVAASPSLRT
ncbi:hypothetical protein BTE77_17225 [Ensifer adhaerens]|nr:hypothetical protein BTE77_17225 [Ensifer adhaerens]